MCAQGLMLSSYPSCRLQQVAGFPWKHLTGLGLAAEGVVCLVTISRGVLAALHINASNHAPVTSIEPAGGDGEGGMNGKKGSVGRGEVRRVTPSCTGTLPPAWHTCLHLSLHHRWPVEVGGDGEREESGHLWDTPHDVTTGSRQWGDLAHVLVIAGASTGSSADCPQP